MMNDPSVFATILKELHHTSHDTIASAIVAIDGIPLCTMLDKGAHPDRIGGMTSALLSLGSRATKELSCGYLKQIIVDGNDGFILMVQATPDLILMMTARPDAKLGLMLLNARDTVKKIQQANA